MIDLLYHYYIGHSELSAVWVRLICTVLQLLALLPCSGDLISYSQIICWCHPLLSTKLMMIFIIHLTSFLKGFTSSKKKSDRITLISVSVCARTCVCVCVFIYINVYVLKLNKWNLAWRWTQSCSKHWLVTRHWHVWSPEKILWHPCAVEVVSLT
jgi:hypothetical protein